MITKKECKQKIQTILQKRIYTKKDSYLFELYINIYLILSKKRKLVQIFIHKKHSSSFSSIQMIKIIKKSYPFFIYHKTNSGYRFILYDKKYNIQKINQSYTTKFAKDLGEFYVCAGNLNKILKKYKYIMRPVIQVSFENKFKKTIHFELFAQMCPPVLCAKNIKLFYQIRDLFQKYMKKINSKIQVDFEIQT